MRRGFHLELWHLSASAKDGTFLCIAGKRMICHLLPYCTWREQVLKCSTSSVLTVVTATERRRKNRRWWGFCSLSPHPSSSPLFTLGSEQSSINRQLQEGESTINLCFTEETELMRTPVIGSSLYSCQPRLSYLPPLYMGENSALSLL